MNKMQLLCAAASIVEEKKIMEDTQKMVHANVQEKDKLLEFSEIETAVDVLCGFKRKQPQVITEVASNNETLLNATKRQRIDNTEQFLTVGLEEDSVLELEQDVESIEEVVEIVGGGNSKKNASMVSVQKQCMLRSYKIMCYINLAKHKESEKIIKELHAMKKLCYNNYLRNNRMADNDITGTEEDKSFNISISEHYKILSELLTQFFILNSNKDNCDEIYNEIQSRVIQIRMNWFKVQIEKKQSKIMMITKLQSNNKHYSCKFFENIIINLKNDYRKIFDNFMSLLSIANTHDDNDFLSLSKQRIRAKLTTMRATCARKMSLIQSKMEEIDLLKEIITISKEKQNYQELKNKYNSYFQHYQIFMQFLHHIFYPSSDINIICQELNQYAQKHNLLEK